MATYSIRAIYKSGFLKLLDPIELTEDQELEVIILDHQAAVRAALGDLAVPASLEAIEESVDEASLMAEIQQAFANQQPLSQTIIEERYIPYTLRNG